MSTVHKNIRYTRYGLLKWTVIDKTVLSLGSVTSELFL